MGVENLPMMRANLVAGIFMLIVACSPVVSGSSEINSPTLLTIAPNIPNKSSNDNDDVDSWDVLQNQIELQIYMAISFMLDEYFVDEFNQNIWQIYNTLKQVNREIEQTLDKCSETLITCGNRFVLLLDQQVNLEKNSTILELEMKNIIDNKLQSMICSNISLELEKKIFENKQLIEESIALKKEQAEKLKAIENEYQLNLTNTQQELEILEEIIFKDLSESADLLKTLTAIMECNEYNVPDDLLEKRQKLFKLNYDEKQIVVVDKLRKRFDDIALMSNSQFSHKYFCNRKLSYYDSTVCAFACENLGSYGIDLSQRNLAVLPKDIFTGLKNLTDLNLWDNRLYYIESSTFDNLSNLRRLDIGSNNLTALSSDIFNDLEKLTYLKLSWNKLNSLQPGTFNNLSNLLRLSLNVNNLTALSSDVFNGLGKLEDLNLSWNKLNSLQPGTFNNLSNLKYLQIHGNHLTALSSGIFNGLEKLKLLDLSNNRLNYLDSDSFNNLPALNKLDIQGNNLTTDSILILITKYFSKFWVSL